LLSHQGCGLTAAASSRESPALQPKKLPQRKKCISATGKSSSPSIGMAKLKKKEHKDTKTTLPYRCVSEATQHYAETKQAFSYETM